MKIRTLSLPSGRIIPALGMGMWYLGEDAGAYFKELELISAALEIGFRFFDTAELYGKGGAEEVLGGAVSSCRKEVFLISKLSPRRTTYEEVVEACGKTLERLKTDYLDMYLLHWMGERSAPDEILEAFSDLKKEGLIRDFGVGNLDCADMAEWMRHDGAAETAMNQGLFDLAHRRGEADLLPFCRERNIPFVAYAAQGENSLVFKNDILRRIASDRGVTPRQIGLAWTLSHKNVGVLARADGVEALKEIYDARRIFLTEDELSALSAAFSPLRSKTASKK